MDAPELLSGELDWVASSEAIYAPLFAGRLGELDQRRAWFSELVARARDGRGETLLGTYLAGRARQGDTAWVEATLDEWVDQDRRLAHVVLDATYGLEPSAAATDRLLRLVQRGWLDRDLLGNLIWAGWVSRLPAEAFRLLLETIQTDESSGAQETTLTLLSTRLRAHTEERDDLASSAWKAIEHRVPLADMVRHAWGEVVAKYLDVDPVRVGRAVLRLHENVGATLFEEDPLMRALADAARRRPREIWESVGAVLLGQDELAYRLQTSLGLWFVDVIDADYLIAWAERHKPAGPRILSAMTIPSGVPLARLSRELLVRFGSDRRVRGYLEGNLHQGPFAGSLSAWYGEKLALARQWTTDTDEGVRRWARGVAASISAQMDQMIQREEEQFGC